MLFAGISLGLQIFIPFPRYAPILKCGLTLTRSSPYVATLFVVHVPVGRGDEARRCGPQFEWDTKYTPATLVAVLGTTISP